MSRPTPKLATAWIVKRRGKRFGTLTAAYYQIAKDLVVAKYPPWLTRGGFVDLDGTENGGWFEYDDAERAIAENRPSFLVDGLLPDGQIRRPFALARHRQRAEMLFCPEGFFDPRRWRKFVTRVAKFLAFADGKRDRFAGLDDAQLAAAFADAERTAGIFMDETTAIRAEQGRRREQPRDA